MWDCITPQDRASCKRKFSCGDFLRPGGCCYEQMRWKKKHPKWQACGLGAPAPQASWGLPEERNTCPRTGSKLSQRPWAVCLLPPLLQLALGSCTAFFPWAEIWSSTSLGTRQGQHMRLHSTHTHSSLYLPELSFQIKLVVCLAKNTGAAALPPCFVWHGIPIPTLSCLSRGFICCESTLYNILDSLLMTPPQHQLC